VSDFFSEILLVTFGSYTEGISTHSNRLEPTLQNLVQRVVQFFHPRSSCMEMHISADVQRITRNVSCKTILGERTEQLAASLALRVISSVSQMWNLFCLSCSPSIYEFLTTRYMYSKYGNCRVNHTIGCSSA